jgi:predicted ABC-type ATPase
MSGQKEVYIVGGPNGSGKTTFIKQFLPQFGHTKNFINADDIAVGLSPLNDDSTS